MYCATITYSQDTLKFLSTIYVKDAIGNIDSVTIGTSYYSNSVYNPEFGELALETPFDSILEVRAGHAGLWDYLESNYVLSKKIISGSHTKIGKLGYPIKLFINAKYQPVTIIFLVDFHRYFLVLYYSSHYSPSSSQPIMINVKLYAKQNK